MVDVPKTSILNVLATLPDGSTPGPLSLDALGHYLSVHCNTTFEKERNKRHALRDELYRDGGDHHMRDFIAEQFRDPQVRELRQRWVKYSKFNNALKRIVNELSTVYAEPAKRTVGGGAANNKKYQDLLEQLCMDEQMLQMSRLLNLHRALLVGVRVRMKPDGTREPVVQLATPAIVRAVLHPNDATEVVGWMIATSFRTAPGMLPDQNGQPSPTVMDSNKPAWTLWTDTESMFLRENLSVIGSSYKTHELGVMPWVPITLSPPASGFWPGCEGEDLVAAHIAIWFANILLLKETKSATKQPVLSGDSTTMARGQAADSEVPIELGDGQRVNSIDMSMDLEMFSKTSTFVLEAAGHNYGLGPSLINHQGVQSAQARELMRIPINELRKHQQSPLLRFEKRFVVVTAAVIKADLPTAAFKPDGFLCEFGQPSTPLSPSDDMDLFISRREAGLDTTVDYLQRLHPGMDEAQASELLEANIKLEEARNALMRPTAAMNGAAAGGLNNGGGAPGASDALGQNILVPAEEKDGAPKAATSDQA